MATKVVQTLGEDKQGLQKQLGCMNGIFQLFDRRYLLGLHRHGAVQHRLTAGPDEKEFKNSSEKAKNKNQKKMVIEKNQASVESSRNSFSSSSSSTTFSSFDSSKRVQTEWQLPPDIREVVKESMTREIRVTKHERARLVMKHIDSPRPFVHQKSTQYDKKDRNLAKVSSTVKEVKEMPRLSCDERESQYSLKSTYVEEPPRLSLDSQKNSNQKSMNESRSEPGSNKRPSAGVVARLMGLDSLTDSVCEVETLKIKPNFSDQYGSSSPRVHTKIQPALQQRKGGDLAFKKPSVYGEMEKKLNALEFSTSGKDLRALKQILDAMQMSKTGLKNKVQPLDTQKPDQPCSPMVKGTNSPKRRELVKRAMKSAKMAAEPKVITGHHHVNHTARKQVSVRISKNTKATGSTPSPRVQNSRNGVDKQRLDGPSSDSSRIKKQSNLKTKQPKIKPIKPMLNNEQLCSYINNGDAVSLRSTINTNLDSQSKPEVTRNKQPKENHRNTFAERLIEDKPMIELPKLSVEQPSPVSVLDAFYIEDSLSPITNKPNDFNDDESLHDDQTECNRVGIYNLVNNTDAYQHSEFNQVKVQNKDQTVQNTELLKCIDETLASPCESTNIDHRYIREILLASGLLNDLDSAIRIVQLHPTCSLINPELFQLLEKSYAEDDEKNTQSIFDKRIRRRMIFDAVNEMLLHKLVNWNDKICGRFMNGEKLLEELWSEIDVLQTCSNRCIYDEDDDDDEVKNIVSADVNKTSEDWDKCCYEVSGVVLDIERLVFKDLINEVVNAEVASLQDHLRRRRRLFSV